VAITGCESQPAINRVQPNVTRKADLLGGEWYFLSTVVDTPYATEFTFVGEQGQLERVEWEIQEDFLVARRSYEFVSDSDPQGINGTTDSAGAVVAAYRIQSHFDIRYDYNPVTGERLNVISENTVDRPWHEREHMRVDWSQNLVQDPNFFLIQRYFDGLQTESIAWYVQDEDDPNAPRFVRADPSDESSAFEYMEITNKMFVTPTTVDIPGLGPLPSCLILQFLDGNPVDCAPGEVTVRNSFLRVDPDHDYQPFVYTGDRMDRFGYFVTERAGYDSSYGLVEPLRYRFANRHNLWAASHRRNDDGSFLTCTSDTQCDDGRGSVCDRDWGRARRALDAQGRILGACTIPYRDRAVQPVVYYTTENYPADLRPEMDALQADYSRAMGEVIASLRENECLAHGGTDCESERAREDQANVFYVCPSPVPEGAPEACGEPGTVARIGDLRFSLVGWVSEPHRASPLGYGPSAADPMTGEIIAGNAFLYGAGIETVSAFGRDIVRLLNGDIDEADLADGAAVEAWIERLSAERDADGESPGERHVVPVEAADIPRLDAAMDFSWARSGDPRVFRGAARSPAELVERVSRGFDRLDAAGVFGGDRLGTSALDRLQGTDIERLLTNRDARVLAGIDPSLPLSDSILEAASPLRSMRVDHLIARSRLRDRLQEHAGVDFGEFADEGLLGLARSISQAARRGEPVEWYGVSYSIVGEDGVIDYELVRNMLRHPILHGLALHEVGHTVGLRHNFSGSYDAVNYAPGYWELRDDGDMHPRNWDPITSEEIDGRLGEYAYSTVMDYGNNFVVTDARGLGHYDFAALKMGYGDLVEVFEEVEQPTEVAWAGFIQSIGWPVTLTLEAGFGGTLSAYAYTEWPGLVGGRENLERRRDVPYTSLRNETMLGAGGIDYPVMDREGRIAVPYRFCSDEQADLSPGCYRYDSGADAYESVQSVIDSYWNYYIFTNFRRERLGFNVESTADRILGRYFEKMQRANQVYALYRGVFQDIFSDAPGYDAFWTAERGMGSYTAAVGSAYQALLRVVTAPEPGGYGRGTRGDGTVAYLPDGGDIEVDAFDGRYLETTWDFDAGYFWFDQLARVGYFYDKVLALMVLTDPTTYFLGRDTDSDIRRYQLNFASTFGPSMTRFFGALLGEDWRAIAPRSNRGVLEYPDPLEIEEGSMPGTPVSPNASFSIQLYASVYGMALIPQTYDQAFINRSRVWVRGGAEEVSIDPSLPTVEYTDPDSGLTYVAVSYEDASGVEQGVGAQLINRAQTLAARAATGNEQAGVELASFIDNLDLIRMLTWHLGFGAQP
jgi:hypothetical protein